MKISCLFTVQFCLCCPMLPKVLRNPERARKTDHLLHPPPRKELKAAAPPLRVPGKVPGRVPSLLPHPGKEARGLGPKPQGLAPKARDQDRKEPSPQVCIVGFYLCSRSWRSIQFYMYNRKRKNRHWKTVPKVLATLYCEKFHLNGDIWLWIYAKLKVGTSVTNSTTEKHSSKAFIWMLTLWDLTHRCKSHNHLVQRNKQHHRKAQLKSFHLNSHILFRLQKVRFNGFRLKLTQ